MMTLRDDAEAALTDELLRGLEVTQAGYDVDPQSAREAILAALAPLFERVEQDHSWREIESAPQDGTDVLLCWDDGVAAPAYAVGHNLGYGRRWQTTHSWLHNEQSWPTHWQRFHRKADR